MFESQKKAADKAAFDADNLIFKSIYGRMSRGQRAEFRSLVCLTSGLTLPGQSILDVDRLKVKQMRLV